MAVIAILNQKGGSGKTTIATHLARALQIRGSKVLLVDSDPQGSARDWAAADEEQEVPVVAIDRPTIERDVASLGRHDFIVIDGAPQAANLAVSAIRAADVVVIPVQPSPYDIWATEDLVGLVTQRIELTEGRLKAWFLISREIRRSRLGAEVDAALKDYGLPVLNTRITQRVSYAGSAATGRTVMDLEPGSAAAAEMFELAAEIRAVVGMRPHLRSV